MCARAEQAGVTGVRSRRRRSVLIVVQNLPLPRDRRVWLECLALRDAGWEVSAITPKAEGDARYELRDGIHLYKYAAPPTGMSAWAFVVEFVYCWLRTAALSVAAWRRHRFSVLQACNPPDTYWLLALLYRPLGVRFVFDQHDLCPEVYKARTGGNPRSLLVRGLYWLERMTYRTATRVISTNESYRGIAIRRGHVPPDRAAVVRSGPDESRMQRRDPEPALRRGRQHLAVYLGVMGPQDGVDDLIRAVDHYVNVLGRNDCTFAVLGTGDCYADLVRQVTALGLDDVVDMPGWVDDVQISRYLSTASVGLCPDPPSAFNDASTMNKTLEYMAYGVPIVSYDLTETRFSAQSAARYVSGDRFEDFAAAVVELLDDPEERGRMGPIGRARIVDALGWRHQQPRYVGVYDSLELPHGPSDSGGAGDRRVDPAPESVDGRSSS